MNLYSWKNMPINQNEIGSPTVIQKSTTIGFCSIKEIIMKWWKDQYILAGL